MLRRICVICCIIQFLFKIFFEYYKMTVSLRVVELKDVLKYIADNNRMTQVKSGIGILKDRAIEAIPLDEVEVKDKEIEELKARVRELENKIEGMVGRSESGGDEEVPMTVIGGESGGVVERNLGRVGKRLIKFGDGSIVSNYDIILYEDTIPLKWKGILTQDEMIVRRNIRASKDPLKTSKRRSISHRYYIKRKGEATIVGS